MKKLEELPKTKSEYEIFTKDLSRRSVSNQYMKRYFYSDGTILSEDRYDKDGNLTKEIFFNSDGTIESEHRYYKDGNHEKVI